MRSVVLALLSFFALASSSAEATNVTYPLTGISNTCIFFQVSQGTGCDWMCQYCANQLGTYNYYFTNDVCTYQTGGCVGNPQAGVTYTCCSA